MTVVDTTSKDYVRAFLRKGDTLVINLTAGKYSISYTTGSTWYDSKTGFGSSGKEYPNLDSLDIKYTVEGGWITYYTYTITFYG